MFSWLTILLRAAGLLMPQVGDTRMRGAASAAHADLPEKLLPTGTHLPGWSCKLCNNGQRALGSDAEVANLPEDLLLGQEGVLR